MNEKQRHKIVFLCKVYCWLLIRHPSLWHATCACSITKSARAWTTIVTFTASIRNSFPIYRFRHTSMTCITITTSIIVWPGTWTCSVVYTTWTVFCLIFSIFDLNFPHKNYSKSWIAHNSRKPSVLWYWCFEKKVKSTLWWEKSANLTLSAPRTLELHSPTVILQYI